MCDCVHVCDCMCVHTHLCVHACDSVRLRTRVQLCVCVTPCLCAHSCSTRRPRTAWWLFGAPASRHTGSRNAVLCNRKHTHHRETRGRGDRIVCKCQVHFTSVSEGRVGSAASDRGGRAAGLPRLESGDADRVRQTRFSSVAAGFLLTCPPFCPQARPTDALGQTGPAHRVSPEPQAGSGPRSGVSFTPPHVVFSFQWLGPPGTFAVLKSEWCPRVLP